MSGPLFIIIEIAVALGVLAMFSIMGPYEGLKNPNAGAFAIAIGLCFVAMAILARSIDEKPKKQKTISGKVSEL